MGRKKQRVRWTAVEDGFFGVSEEEYQGLSDVTPMATSNDLDSSNVGKALIDAGQDRSDDANSAHSAPVHYCRSYGSRCGGDQVLYYGSGRAPYYKSYYGPAGCGGQPRRSGVNGGHWLNAPLAPRFERKAAHSGYNNVELNRSFDQDSCFDLEEMPNGFTKIRSKNLDVLFKKDYYAQKLLNVSSNVSSEHGDEVIAAHDATSSPSDGEIKVLPVEKAAECNGEDDKEKFSLLPSNQTSSQKTKCTSDNENIACKNTLNVVASPEEVDDGKVKEVDEEKSEVDASESEEKNIPIPPSPPPTEPSKPGINSNARPFYPRLFQHNHSSSIPLHHFSQVAQQGHQPLSQNRPNLFLYSPSSNTMIPCDEIIIPSHPLMINNDIMARNNPVGVPNSHTTVYMPGGVSPGNYFLTFAVDGSTPGSGGTSPVESSMCATSPTYVSHPQGIIQDFSGVQMVHYDQYGVPYTSYHAPSIALPLQAQPLPQQQIQDSTRFSTHNSSSSPSPQQQEQQPAQSGNTSGSENGTEPPSSADSTNPCSPPDLSMYSPANWLPNPSSLHHEVKIGPVASTSTSNEATNGSNSTNVMVNAPYRPGQGYPNFHHNAHHSQRSVYHQCYPGPRQACYATGHHGYRFSGPRYGAHSSRGRHCNSFNGGGSPPWYGRQDSAVNYSRICANSKVAETSTVTSSAGDSPVVDRSEDEADVRHRESKRDNLQLRKSTAMRMGTTKPTGLKSSGDNSRERPLIPGLPERLIATKRTQKKRRKKRNKDKAESPGCVAASNSSNQIPSPASPFSAIESKKESCDTVNDGGDAESCDLFNRDVASNESQSDVEEVGKTIVVHEAISTITASLSVREGSVISENHIRQEDDEEADCSNDSSEAGVDILMVHNNDKEETTEMTDNGEVASSDSVLPCQAPVVQDKEVTTEVSLNKDAIMDGDALPVEDDGLAAVFKTVAVLKSNVNSVACSVSTPSPLSTFPSTSPNKSSIRRRRPKKGNNTQVDASADVSLMEKPSINTTSNHLHTDVEPINSFRKSYSAVLGRNASLDSVGSREVPEEKTSNENKRSSEESEVCKSILKPNPAELIIQNDIQDGGWELSGKLKRSKKNRNTSINQNVKRMNKVHQNSTKNTVMPNSASPIPPCVEESPSEFTKENFNSPVDELQLSSGEQQETFNTAPVVSEKDKSISDVCEQPMSHDVSSLSEKVPEEFTELDRIKEDEERPDIAAQTRTPMLRKSTLKKPRKKKNCHEDNSGSEVNSSSSTRPILIKDGFIDIQSEAAAFRRFKRASDVLDQQRLDMAVTKGHIDSHYVSDIGYGVIDGPILMNRFGIGKYSPPARLDEIIPMQKKLLAKNAGSEKNSDGSATTVIKVMMGEVISTEIYPEDDKIGETNDVTDAKEATVPIPDAIVNGVADGTTHTSIPTSAELDLD